MKTFTFFTLAVFITALLLISTSSATGIHSVRSGMFKSRPFAKESYQFTPFDKMYLAIDFTGLDTGSYTMLTDWITPWGSLEHQASHSFTITDPAADYKVFSWLRLWKNGPFRRVMSGEEFKNEFYGSWQVIVYLTGNRVARHQFQIQ